MYEATLPNTRIIIPVRNGGALWKAAAQALRAALADPLIVVVVDSASTDGSDRVALEQGFEVHRIDVATFNHGRTRQEAVARFCVGKELVIFATQDAVVTGPASLTKLVAAFEDPKVGAAYGRQLPRPDARPFEAHAALFNYKPVSETRTLADSKRLGIKAAFLSNSFAAYRVSALLACGGFPDHLIAGEDACVAMRLLLAGWSVRYCADAQVHHSHAFNLLAEMQRYFDWGVMHAQIPELLRTFGQPEGEGARYVLSELRHMKSQAPWLLPEVIARNALKYAGYRLGRGFKHLPRGLCRRLSHTKIYWQDKP